MDTAVQQPHSVAADDFRGTCRRSCSFSKCAELSFRYRSQQISCAVNELKFFRPLTSDSCAVRAYWPWPDVAGAVMLRGQQRVEAANTSTVVAGPGLHRRTRRSSLANFVGAPVAVVMATVVTATITWRRPRWFALLAHNHRNWRRSLRPRWRRRRPGVSQSWTWVADLSPMASSLFTTKIISIIMPFSK